MAQDNIKIDPEQLKASVSQIANNLSGVTDVTSAMKFEITQNTLPSLKQFETSVKNIKSLLEGYQAKYTQNLHALTQNIMTIEELDNALASGVASSSSGAQLPQPQSSSEQSKGF